MTVEYQRYLLVQDEELAISHFVAAAKIAVQVCSLLRFNDYDR